MAGAANTASCEVCPGLSHRVVWGEGPSATRLVLIGEAPGSTEDATGRPFVGGAGNILNNALVRAGISRSQVYITNVVKCRPPGNRTPNSSEVLKCFPLLKAELANIKFNCLVPMGNTAFSALLNRQADITTYRGSPTFTEVITHPDGSPIKVLPTLHPAFIMRQWLYSEVLATDLKKAWKYAEDPVYHPPIRTETGRLVGYLLPEDPEAAEYIESLKQTGCAADIETTSLHPWTGEILGIAFSNAPNTGIFLKFPEHIELAKSILEHPCLKIFQFGTFDVFFLQWHGIHTVNYMFDTKFAQNIVCPEMPSSLAFLSSIYTMFPYYKTWKGKEIRKDPGAVPQAILQEYCTQDADATWQCAAPLKEELESEGQTELFNTLIMPLAKVLMSMRSRGIRISHANLQKVSDEIVPQLAMLDHAFAQLGVNPNSPKQLGELLTANNIILPKTKTGAFQTDEEALRDAQRRYPEHAILGLIMEFRELNKIDSTYVEGIRKHAVGDRLFAELVIGGTATGRLSSRDPNLQNVPKHFRGVFIPEEGHTFIEVDYKQMELRVAAVLAQDQALLSDIEHGLDIPNKIGAALHYDEERSKKERVLLKAVLYGSLYGRTARSIAIAFNISTASAQSLIDILFRYYPNLRTWLKEQEVFANQNRYLRSAFGRKRFFLEPGRVSNQAFNFPVQSAAADVMLTSLILIDQAFPETLKLTVHDSVLLSVEHHEVDRVVQGVIDILERPIPQLHNYRFATDPQTGPTWGDLSPWKNSK